MKISKHKPETQHRGFSLVELLVATTLSLFLVAGVVQMYLSSKESYRLQGELAQLQENQRLAMVFLQKDIRRAGFFFDDDPANPNVNPIAKFDLRPDPSASGLLKTRDGDANANDLGDVITVRYETSAGLDSDCVGQTVTEVDPTDGNVYIVNQYYLDEVTDAEGKITRQLMCRGNGNVNQPQPLVSGILDMQILYGEDTDAPVPGVTPTANRYVKLEQANPNRVVSVRISLLLTSLNSVKPKSITRNYTLLDKDLAAISDRNRHQVVTTTILLRNNT